MISAHKSWLGDSCDDGEMNMAPFGLDVLDVGFGEKTEYR